MLERIHLVFLGLHSQCLHHPVKDQEEEGIAEMPFLETPTASSPNLPGAAL
jgi:hypothetical protein